MFLNGLVRTVKRFYLPAGGNVAVGCQGMRWISHKQSLAMHPR